MSFWSNLKKAVGGRVKSTKRNFEEGLGEAKEMKEAMFPKGTNWRNFKTGVEELGSMIKTPFQDLYKTLTPDKTQGNISMAGQSALGKPLSPLQGLPTPDPSKDPLKTITYKGKSLSEYGQEARKERYGVFEKAGLLPIQLQAKEEEAKLAKIPAPIQMGAAGKPQGILDAMKQAVPTPITPPPTTPSEYDLISPEGQKKVAEAEAATGLKGAEAIRAFSGRTTTPLQEGMDKLGMPLTPTEDLTPALQENIKKATIGVSDPRTAETIKSEIAQIQGQIATLQWQLDRIPGVSSSDKDAYTNMMNTWAEGGASAEQIAQIVDNMTRADEDMLSNQILPTYKKYLETPTIKKANQTMEDLYEKYSTAESDLDNLRAEANQAINAIKQSSYLTQSMIVGRVDRMRDEYNMEISAKQNQLNTLGKDIDRGRSSLKDMMTEGFKMAEIDIGSLGMGIQEDILGKTGLGWESVAKMLSAKEAGKAPETIGAGRFQYKDKGYEQVTPFAPSSPTARQETQRVDQEHDTGLQGLVSGEGFVPLEAFIEMAQNWMMQTGIRDPQKYLNMFGQKYLSETDKKDFMYQMSGVKSFDI